MQVGEVYFHLVTFLVLSDCLNFLRIRKFKVEVSLNLLRPFFFFFFLNAQQFENDTLLIPKETSWFGYYPDGAFKPVLPPQQLLCSAWNLVYFPNLKDLLTRSSFSWNAKTFKLPIWALSLTVNDGCNFCIMKKAWLETHWLLLQLEKEYNANSSFPWSKGRFWLTISWVNLRMWRKQSDYL